MLAIPAAYFTYHTYKIIPYLRDEVEVSADGFIRIKPNGSFIKYDWSEISDIKYNKYLDILEIFKDSERILVTSDDAYSFKDYLRLAKENTNCDL